jgi:geranylgeranyl diphosphate synthase type II
LQDDYLDALVIKTFGKQVGGDIIEKKTVFIFKSSRIFCQEEASQLLHYFRCNLKIIQLKIESVKEIIQAHQKRLKKPNTRLYLQSF